MSRTTSHSRRYLIAGGAVLTTAFGPTAGAIAPQLYVNSLPNAEIPQHGRYVLVDAASARLYMMDDGRVQDSMRVIVGKPETPTPALRSVLNYETLNPYWHVTREVAQEVIAPRVLKDGDAYLNKQGYEVVSSFGNPQLLSPDDVDWKGVAAGNVVVKVRQKPGPANSLGRFKFDIPNSDGIYLHDTPKKELFALDVRSLSHGCVRLEDAPRLAKWLLGQDPPAASAPEEHVRLPQPVPITISYLDLRSQMQLASLR